MSLLLRVKALAEAVGADIKSIKTDPRLTDSREWSEETVTQAEAEAGIASTRRAWTAQRVRQAINAWWQLVTSGFGRNLVSASNEQAARNALQLTYPATASTVGDGDEVMRVGAHGIGDMGSHLAIPTSLIYNSFWEGNCLTINSKESPYGSMLILQQKKLLYGTVNDTDGIWITEIITDQNQVVLGKTAETARAALELTGEWVDLRPYLKPGFYWEPTREGKNPHPQIRKLSCGRVELDGIVSFNETSDPLPVGVFVNVPSEFRPPLTTGGLMFGDTA